MMVYEIFCVFVTLSAVWRVVTMTMYAKSLGPARNGFAPEANTTKLDAESLIDCQLKCDIDPQCMSVFYSKLENKCSVYNMSFVDTTVLTPEKGWTYLQSLSDRCPANYIYAKAFGMCYKIHRDENLKMDYPNFKAICGSEGTEVLKITKEAITEHIIDVMARHQNALKYFAINGHYDGSNWVYDDGTPLIYTNWGPNRPMNDLNIYKQAYLYARKTCQWNNKVWVKLTYPCGFMCGKYID